jgi:hypothetical protein
VKQLYLDIKQRIEQKCPEILHIAVFNNQIELLKNNYSREGVYDQSIYVFPRPAVFIEFESPQEIHQLGNGAQVYDPLNIRVHLLHEFFNGENYEENLEVFDLKLALFKVLQRFEPNGCVAWTRISEEQDTDHTALYHFVMVFRTNYVDNGMRRIVGGVEKQTPNTLDLTIDLDIDNTIIRTGDGD